MVPRLKALMVGRDLTLFSFIVTLLTSPSTRPHCEPEAAGTGVRGLGFRGLGGPTASQRLQEQRFGGSGVRVEGFRV